MVHAWKHDDTDPQALDAATFQECDATDRAPVWIDLEGGEPKEHRTFLQERIGLPRLAVDDAMRKRHPPKDEDRTTAGAFNRRSSLGWGRSKTSCWSGRTTNCSAS